MVFARETRWAAMNGMALFGSVIPFGGTFQTFSDYMRPAIRLAALSDTQTIFVFTRFDRPRRRRTDASVGRASRRNAIPNLAVIRPRDAHETREALACRDQAPAPTAFALSRQRSRLSTAKVCRCKGPARGCIRTRRSRTKAGKATAPKLIIIATGSEVGLAMEAREHRTPPGRDRSRVDAVLGVL
ncbi:MAG: hypothetical protein IPN51_03555 [Chloracidobacterium sp.]|nr:hypothetical protein [Chloracidobacterium sp.]